ncbi:MAG: hypothetical protein AAF212_01160 [Verrucomicrobiota bacterium]
MSFTQIISTAIAIFLITSPANAFFQGGLLFCTVIDSTEEPDTGYLHLITVIRENDQTPDVTETAVLDASEILNSEFERNTSSDMSISDVLNSPEFSVGDFSEFSTLSVSEVTHSN